jgi:hypothetical protein
MIGFGFEGGTELFQFLERASLGQGALVYFSTLATTILGFYLMFLGAREWRVFHAKPPVRRQIPWLLIQLLANAALSVGLWMGRHVRRIRQKYLLAWSLGVIGAAAAWTIASVMVERPVPVTGPAKRPWFGLALWSVGTGATALVGLVLAGGGGSSTPLWMAAPVGGLIFLLFGSFFFGLRQQVRPLASWTGNGLGWAALGWSLGVGIYAGVVVGRLTVQLLTEFVTNWSALIASFAPVVVAISPLFVAYALILGTYGTAARNLHDQLTSPSPPLRELAMAARLDPALPQ